MKRAARYVSFSFIGMTALGLGGVFSSAYLADPPYAASYIRELTATGLVEGVRFLGLKKRHCAVEVATYAWVNLSPGFPLQEVPQRGDRYTLYAPRDICLAAQVAAAGAEGHILYEAGEGESGRWYLTARPTPALSCGGRLDW